MQTAEGQLIWVKSDSFTRDSISSSLIPISTGEGVFEIQLFGDEAGINKEIKSLINIFVLKAKMSVKFFE